MAGKNQKSLNERFGFPSALQSAVDHASLVLGVIFTSASNDVIGIKGQRAEQLRIFGVRLGDGTLTTPKLRIRTIRSAAMSEGGIQPKGCTRIRIDITADDDLHLWSKRFDVTPAEIKRVVLKVGPFATDVERELYKTG